MTHPRKAKKMPRNLFYYIMFYTSLENIRKKYFNEKDLTQTLAENSQTEFKCWRYIFESLIRSFVELKPFSY